MLVREPLYYPFVVATTPVGVFRGAVTPTPMSAQLAELELQRIQDRHEAGESLELFCGKTASKLHLASETARTSVLALSLLPAVPRPRPV